MPDLPLRERIKGVLLSLMGEGGVEEYSPLLQAYGRDLLPLENILLRDGIVRFRPGFVVWPERREEVASLLSFCSEMGIPVIPYGGGAGVCGGAIPEDGGVVLDMKRMRRVESIDRERLLVRAQAGIIGMELEELLNFSGFTLGHFPSSLFCSTLGGFLAARSAGQFSSKYGKIEDMVSSMEIATPDGEIAELCDADLSPPFYRVLCGQEGRLFVNTAATLHIHPLQRGRAFRGLLFPHLSGGISAMRGLMQEGLNPIVLRLYDELDTFLNMHKGEEGVSRGGKMRGGLTGRAMKEALKRPRYINILGSGLFHSSLMILGFEAEDDETACRLMDEAMRVIRANAGEFRDLGEEPGLRWLAERYSVSFKLSSVFKAGSFADTIEVATHWRNLLPLYRSVVNRVRGDALIMAHFSHAYPEGCSIYFTLAGTGRGREGQVRKYLKIWDGVMREVLSLEGAISHHHGVGALKSPFLKGEGGGGLISLSRLIKEGFDPKGVMNPEGSKVHTIWKDTERVYGMDAGQAPAGDRPAPLLKGLLQKRGEGLVAEGLSLTPSLFDDLDIPPLLLPLIRNTPFAAIFTASSMKGLNTLIASAGDEDFRIITGGGIWTYLPDEVGRSPEKSLFLHFEGMEGVRMIPESCTALVPGSLPLHRVEEEVRRGGFTTSLPPPFLHGLPLSWEVPVPPPPPAFYLNPVSGMPLNPASAILWNGETLEIPLSPRRADGIAADELLQGSLDTFGVITGLKIRIYPVIQGVRATFALRGSNSLKGALLSARGRRPARITVNLRSSRAGTWLFLSSPLSGEFERSEWEKVKGLIAGEGELLTEEGCDFPDTETVKTLFPPCPKDPCLEFYAPFPSLEGFDGLGMEGVPGYEVSMNAGEKGVFMRFSFRGGGGVEGILPSLIETFCAAGFTCGKNALFGIPLKGGDLHPLFRRFRDRR